MILVDIILFAEETQEVEYIEWNKCTAKNIFGLNINKYVTVEMNKQNTHGNSETGKRITGNEQQKLVLFS